MKVGPSPAGTGLGLLATSGIKRGEQVLIVPLSLAISMDTVRAGPVGRAIGGWEPNLGETTLLAVQLLYEAAQGDKSKCVCDGNHDSTANHRTPTNAPPTPKTSSPSP